MFQASSRILYNKEIAPAHFKIALDAPKIAKAAKPGQFVHLLVSQDKDPLLRRPLSIHKVKGNSVELLYKVIGRGTEILSQKKPGEKIDLIGPLGNGFMLTAHSPAPKALLVAGGMGVAPLVFLAEKLKKPMILLGARDTKSLVCVSELKKLGCNVKIATDNGSAGFKGFVSELLKKELIAQGLRPTDLYACGPKLMLKEIAKIAKENKIQCQVSLEEKMACGVGACLGCAVDTINGYKMVCKDGPVFNAQEIIW